MARAGEKGKPVRQVMPLVQAFRLVEEHRAAGRLDEAEGLARQILEARPDEPQAAHHLGLITHQRGQLGAAIEQVKRATELAPNVALYHANLGEMYRLAGQLELAIKHGKRAVAIKPDYPEALSNIGIAYYERKDFEKALASHRRAIALNPNFERAYSNCGNVLHGLRRFDEAVQFYRRAVELKPDFADGWSNLGTSLHHSGRFEEAILALRRAIALDPGHANAHCGLGILLLMRGDLAEGWEEYEWRLNSTEVKLTYHPQRPWKGESLKGRHIYIQAEQGFGDTMHFARYLPLVAARAASVTFRVQQGLTGLMRQSMPGIEVLGDRGAPATVADCECALLSLPYIFGTRLETIPADVPYLRADDDAAVRWRERFAVLRGLKVGLAWAGNPEHVNDMRRSLALDELAALFAVPDVSFVSLQVGPRAADLERHRDLEIVDVASDLVPFAATAAVMAALDLVITIDSSLAHLAGALAKPTWLLTSWVPDWRWFFDREDSPWYPTMRLFRQAENESWRAVVSRMATELGKVAQGDRTALTPFRAAGEKRAASAAAIITAREIRIASPPPAAALSPPQVLAFAEQRRRAGKFAQAELLAHRVLDAKPDNAEANHLLGIVAHQSGNLAHAIEHVKRATELAPNVALYHANLGEMYRLAKRPDEAIAYGERALALNADYPDALSNLGIAHYERADYEKAVAYYRRAIALNPKFAQAHSNLGNALRALKCLDEALPCFRRALELQPQFADAWNNLATTLRDLKKHEEAEAAYRKALALKPDEPETLNSLALCLKDMRRPDEAETLLRRSYSIESHNAKTLLYLGTLLLDQDKVDEAAAAAERALAIDPANHDAVNLMGRIAFERNDLVGAETQFRRVLDLKPDHADAFNNMGNLLKVLGKFDEARASYLQALALDPGVMGVYVNYANSAKFSANDPHLKAMEAMRDGSVPLSDADRLNLDFALAKAYADLNDHARSFERLLSGNALKRAQMQYDEAEALAFFDRIQAVFTPALLREKKKIRGNPSRTPIFILGMPRSGSTLVEQILASHRDVHGGGELKIFARLTNTMCGPDGRPISYPEFVADLDAGALGRIGETYLAEILKLAPDSPRITDKMPSNYYYAGLIHLALPNACIIHTVRDPLDTCISCFSKLFTGEQNHTYDLGELGRYHSRYRKLMAHWRRILPRGRMLDVRYEDVVADLEGQARRIVAHCGLDWDDNCLSFHTTNRPVRTASASQVRRPIYRSAIGRARVYDKYLGPLKSALTKG